MKGLRNGRQEQSAKHSNAALSSRKRRKKLRDSVVLLLMLVCLAFSGCTQRPPRAANFSAGVNAASSDVSGSARGVRPTSTMVLQKSLFLNHRVESLQFFADNSALAASTSAGRVCEWATQGWRRVHAFEQLDCTDTVVSPDGQTMYGVYINRGVTGRVVATGRRIMRCDDVGGNVSVMAVSHDGASLAVATGRVIKILDATTGRVERTLNCHSHAVRVLVWGPHDHSLFSGADDRTVVKSPLTSGARQLTLSFPAHIGAVSCSDDGRWIAVGGNDNDVRLYSGFTGKCMQVLSGHTDRVWSLAFTPDGNRLASGGADDTVRIWWVKGGPPLQTLSGWGGSVYSLAWSSDGRMLVGGTGDGSVRVWQ